MSEFHPSAQRLYAAATQIKAINGQSAVARLLNVSPQVMRNWELRGVSEKGALTAQGELGIDANWLLTGDGAMLKSGANAQAPHRVEEPAAAYRVDVNWPFKTFDQEEWSLLDRESRTLIENYARGLVDRATMMQRKAS